jgi:hypothetical protein
MTGGAGVSLLFRVVGPSDFFAEFSVKKGYYR